MPVLALNSELTAERDVLGGKAWSIAHMMRQGAKVPPAFVITTDECRRFSDTGRLSGDVLAALSSAMRDLEQQTNSTFGGGESPLLVSVRSGASISMPGMMDTVLNLGQTPDVIATIANSSGDPKFADDLAGRFAEQFTQIVGQAPPADPWEQLHAAIAAVFGSWNSRRAVTYRKEKQIPELGGTAVTVQAMVFGNRDARSGTGVLFSRDPFGRSDAPYGEWLPGGQGEDVVSGRHDPHPISDLERSEPEAYRDLMAAARRLDEAAGCAQDIEFTVQSGQLWLLQTRAAKIQSAPASRHEGGGVEVASGRPASTGVGSGVVVCDSDEAEERALAGEDIILARRTTSPDDVHAMAVVRAVLTEIGGATSHAAVVSRELQVPCVVGCGVDTVTQLEGQRVTVDATEGRVVRAQ
ncbi:PEP/pyruvate-binding domain-containing protein [Micromonospora sp. WMMD736]|uniref:PEP/pyruvate-binding domain-containing protein n=1 Tax=Micromonospora sp. WMMD736 TaxID=3404112 RepID=UPI003B960F63